MNLVVISTRLNSIFCYVVKHATRLSFSPGAWHGNNNVFGLTVLTTINISKKKMLPLALTVAVILTG